MPSGGYGFAVSLLVRFSFTRTGFDAFVAGKVGPPAPLFMWFHP
jgi:hypothetical protein